MENLVITNAILGFIAGTLLAISLDLGRIAKALKKDDK